MFPTAVYLWSGRSLVCARLDDLPWHRHQAAGVCIALDPETSPLFQREANGPWQEFRALRVPPGCGHAFRFRGQSMAFLFFDPGSPYYEIVFDGIAGPELWQDDTAHRAIANIEGLWNGGDPGAISETIAAGMLERIPGDAREKTGAPGAHRPHAGDTDTRPARELSTDREVLDTLEQLYGDPRIQAVVRAILEWPEPDATPRIEDLAEIAGLSPSRLAHLFRDRVGIPIRALRTWFRLKAAAIQIRRGANLTDAALGAGFYDQAHFTRTFRQMFGLPPSRIFSKARANTHWFIEAEALTLALNSG